MTNNDMPDYVKHVRMSHADFTHQTWCGNPVSGWDFLDAEHAAENGRKQGRLIACKSCVTAITKALENGHDEI